jgi:dihydrolipoamide dehydrogenase
MQKLYVDVAVIGAGTAGLAAYRAAKAEGARSVVIEGYDYGTTCARVGCMPSKLLIAAAEAAHGISAAPGFGVHVQGKVRVNGKEVMARVKRERDRFVGFVLDGVEAIPVADRIRGIAKFLADDHLEVSSSDAGKLQVHAKRVVIATGAKATYPDFLNALGDRLIINDDVFSWDDLPNAVLVLGPGVIGLELGQALSRLGVRTTVLGRGGRVGPISDADVRTSAVRAFQEEFTLYPDAELLKITRAGDSIEVSYRTDTGETRTETVDYVLASTGRSPNVNGLGLESTSLKLDGSGVPLFDAVTMQCESNVGQSTIFIAGDANDDLPLLHEAADEGKIAGANAGRYPDVRPGLRRAELGIVFTDPQIAIVGGGHQALTKGSHMIGAVSFDDQGRSRVMLRNKGLLHVYGDAATGRFLGAEMVGPQAEHIGHLLAWALQSGLTVSEMLDMPFYHPVVEEGLRTALRDLDAKLKQGQLQRKAA